MSAVRTHPPAVVTMSYAVELLRFVTSDDIVEKIISIDQNSRSQTAVESVWPVSKL